MERTTSIIKAKEIMGPNFIGPDELSIIADKIGIIHPYQINMPIPELQCKTSFLNRIADDYLLILGIPFTCDREVITLLKMRSFFGIDPKIKEPCFYNQDWYMNEDFAFKDTIDFKWYLVKKEVYEDSRGIHPSDFLKAHRKKMRMPSAILCAFTFFAWYFHSNGKTLWKHDYIWCRDKDYHGDQIYVGRYADPNHHNKNGFNIHRYLRLQSYYGIISEL